MYEKQSWLESRGVESKHGLCESERECGIGNEGMITGVVDRVCEGVLRSDTK